MKTRITQTAISRVTYTWQDILRRAGMYRSVRGNKNGYFLILSNGHGLVVGHTSTDFVQLLSSAFAKKTFVEVHETLTIEG